MNSKSADRWIQYQKATRGDERRAWKLAVEVSSVSLNYRKRKETATTRIMIRRFIKSRSMDRQADISHRARDIALRTHQHPWLHRFPDLPTITTQSLPSAIAFREPLINSYTGGWFVHRRRTRSNTSIKTCITMIKGYRGWRRMRVHTVNNSQSLVILAITHYEPYLRNKRLAKIIGHVKCTSNKVAKPVAGSRWWLDKRDLCGIRCMADI